MITLKSATTTEIHKFINYELMMRLQSLRDTLRNIKTFNSGNDVNRFITDLNKAYTIHDKPELVSHPRIEEGFIKKCQQLLSEGIFQHATRHVQFWTAENMPFSDPRQLDDKFLASQSSSEPWAARNWRILLVN